MIIALKAFTAVAMWLLAWQLGKEDDEINKSKDTGFKVFCLFTAAVSMFGVIFLAVN